MGGLAESKELHPEHEPPDLARELFAEAQKLGRCAAYEWNLVTGIFHFTDNYFELVGRDRSEIDRDASGFLSCVHPDDRERVSATLQRIVATGVHPPVFHRIAHPNGEVRNLVLRGRVDLDEAGHARRIVGFIQDISEQMQREQALRESRTALSEAQTLGALGHFSLHPPGVQIAGSDEFHRLIGTEEGFYVTVHTFPDRFASDDRPLIRRAFQKAIQDGADFDIEARLGACESRLRWVRIKARVEGAGQRFGRITGIVQDIDNQKQLETARLQMSRVDALSQLAGGLAHDFNNFLASVLLNLTTLDDHHGDLEEDVRASIRDAVASARAAQLVTRQLMSFSKGSQPNLERVELAPLVEEAARFSLRGSGCELIFEPPDQPLWVRIDRGQIQQVVNNLVLNARQAQNEVGPILVRITSRLTNPSHAILANPPRMAEVVVQDEGPGISPEHRDRIFTPYFTTKTSGHGLGLASSFSIVKMHRGDLCFDCPPGGGSVFRFTLPTTDAPERVEVPVRKAEGQRQGRVLVLDDDPAVRRVLQRALHRLGFDVVATENGHDTIVEWENAWKAAEPYDLLVLDLTVSGGLGGIEVFDVLRTRHPSLRAVASSGYAHQEGPGSFVERGFVDVLPKPYTFEELRTVIARAMAEEDTDDLA